MPDRVASLVGNFRTCIEAKIMTRAFKICGNAKCSRMFFREHYHSDNEWKKKKYHSGECAQNDYNEKHPGRGGKRPDEPARKTGQYYVRHPAIDIFLRKYQPNGEPA